jgi:type II secretory pathway component PulK
MIANMNDMSVFHRNARSLALHNTKPAAKSQGIALIQILIITAILSLIAIFITKSAQQQVQMAQWSMDRSQATVDLHSARNKVIFTLLTNNWQSDSVNVGGSEQWNLYNSPIQLDDNVTIQLQDQAGLVNLHYPQGGGIVEKILLSQGLESGEALRAQAILFDWQDGDKTTRRDGDETNIQKRDGAMPDIREWLLQNTINLPTLAEVSADFSVYGTSHLNLMTSSQTILAALTNDVEARQLITLRAQGDLSVREMTQKVNMTEEMDIFLSPGNNVKLSLQARFGEARVRQQSMINFTPYVVGNKPPYNILQSSGG